MPFFEIGDTWLIDDWHRERAVALEPIVRRISLQRWIPNHRITLDAYDTSGTHPKVLIVIHVGASAYEARRFWQEVSDATFALLKAPLPDSAQHPTAGVGVVVGWTAWEAGGVQGVIHGA